MQKQLFKLLLRDRLGQEVIHAGLQRNIFVRCIWVGRAAANVGDLILAYLVWLSVELSDSLDDVDAGYPRHTVVK